MYENVEKFRFNPLYPRSLGKREAEWKFGYLEKDDFFADKYYSGIIFTDCLLNFYLYFYAIYIGEILVMPSPDMTILLVGVFFLLCGIASLQLCFLWAAVSTNFVFMLNLADDFSLFNIDIMPKIAYSSLAILYTSAFITFSGIAFEQSAKNEIIGTFGYFVQPSMA